jgi:hypothetical protein
MLLNEVYFGKTKEFEMLEGFLKSYIRKDEDLFDSDHFVKDFKNIKENIEKAFGKRFNINLSLTLQIQALPNACTVPQQLINKTFQDEVEITYDTVEKTSNGFRFKKRTDVFILVFLPFIKMINEREFIGILLHEVGHNMFSYNATGRAMNYINFCLGALKKKEIKKLLKTNISDDYKKNKVLEDQKKKEMNISKIALGFLVNYPLIASSILILKKVGPLLLKLKIITTGLLLFPAIISAISFIFSIILKGSYANEEFADNFANIHGYGPDLASALIKFNNPKYYEKENLYLKIFCIFSDFITLFVNLIGDEHPQTRTRFSNIENYIRKELVTEVSPEKIKLLNKQLNDLKIIDEDYKKEFSELKQTGLGVFSLFDIFKKAASVGQIDIDKFDEKVSVKKD